MDRENAQPEDDLIDLGTASIETKGSDGSRNDHPGLQPATGILLD